MTEQKQQKKTKSKVTQDEKVGQSEESKAQTQKVQDETDALLDEIDDLLGSLEEAEAMVANFIQKGGE